MRRRELIRLGISSGILAMLGLRCTSISRYPRPVAVATWNHGQKAVEFAWRVLQQGGTLLDAVEAGVRQIEADPAVRTVGLGGFPDATGQVTLDASIMEGTGRCGAVAFLVGDAAFDTVGLLMADAAGRLAGVCSTSGAAFKLRGRVGDSPIIGARLFVDDEAGAACATGWGEGVIRIAGAHLIVELMRQGDDPEVACRKAVVRYRAKNAADALQVGFLALRRDGAIGAYSLQPGFTYAVKDARGVRLLQAPSLLG